jgi:alkylation response protein AidB-like acyl-CoA dehydrogenase
MTVIQERTPDVYIEEAEKLARTLAENAAERDRAGGTPKRERDLIRRSGLLKLTIPEPYGGDGQPWSVALAVTRQLAKADGSIAHLFGYHLAVLANFQRLGTTEQAAYYLEGTVRNNWFWGNTVNVRTGVSRVVGSRTDNGVLLSGTKRFTTGTPDADFILVTWENEETGDIVSGAIPSGREGVTVHDDWDGIGQRQTGSGSVTFHQAVVYSGEILEARAEQTVDPYNPPLTQSVLTNVYLGNAQGALEQAKEYIQSEALP